MASRESSHDSSQLGYGTHRTPWDPPVRDPAAYSLTDHFRRRLRQPGRYVTLPIASDAIRTGQLRWNRTDGWRFALVRDGVRYVIVVGDTETNSPVIVTGWTEVASWAEAVESERWREEDLHTIQLRGDLSAAPNEQIPLRIRPREIDRPMEIGSHRITTRAGLASVVCDECHGQYRSKTELLSTRCRSSSRAGYDS
ncbi:hypothetical protein ACFO0N_14355 [Halobium salinum]|uniref:Uncharacterized protein n=1 Tax=Halobium salinum TaxID=1364940 RepID=A0ABD5PEQ0_9EURY|nr:hypothetical protein [Halobium salinum]